jgi:broad specificity phosphatase PhoE
MPAIVHLVRHGRIPNYDTDQSLTAQGREEAWAVGRGLAAAIRPGETVRFFSSPARRARETAALLRDGLSATLAEMNVAATLVTQVEVDDRLQNNQFYLNGASYDPIVPLLDIARWRLQENPGPENEAAVTLQTEFWTAPDPVTYWLTQPNKLAESPAAVVKRLQACLLEHLEGNAFRRDICVTHSANLRAFLRQVFGYDPGPPPFSGMLTVSEGRVEYQGQSGDFSIG